MPTTVQEWQNIAFIVPDNKKHLVPHNAQFISLCTDTKDLKGANHNLYTILHRLDNDTNIKHAYIDISMFNVCIVI